MGPPSLGSDSESMLAGHPLICARRHANAVALCGKPPPSLWTTQKCAVTCEGCLAEIGRRLAERPAPKK